MPIIISHEDPRLVGQLSTLAGQAQRSQIMLEQRRHEMDRQAQMQEAYLARRDAAIQSRLDRQAEAARLRMSGEQRMELARYEAQQNMARTVAMSQERLALQHQAQLAKKEAKDVERAEEMARTAAMIEIGQEQFGDFQSPQGRQYLVDVLSKRRAPRITEDDEAGQPELDATGMGREAHRIARMVELGDISPLRGFIGQREFEEGETEVQGLSEQAQLAMMFMREGSKKMPPQAWQALGESIQGFNDPEGRRILEPLYRQLSEERDAIEDAAVIPTVVDSIEPMADQLFASIPRAAITDPMDKIEAKLQATSQVVSELARIHNVSEWQIQAGAEAMQAQEEEMRLRLKRQTDAQFDLQTQQDALKFMLEQAQQQRQQQTQQLQQRSLMQGQPIGGTF